LTDWPARSAALRRRVVRIALLAPLLALFAAPAARVAGADDVQPIPPRLFFGEPDTVAKQQIDELISNSFGDISKAVAARDVLVRRFGLWSAPQLVERIKTGANETIVRNALLTIATLRREKGASEFLWPAIPALSAALKKESADPWRRAFAALALGTFYGAETARRGPASRQGTEAGAVAAAKWLREADEALVAALSDADPNVTAAASLALGKIGGMANQTARAALREKSPPPSSPEAAVAELLCVGLLPGNDDRVLSKALSDPEARIRAAAALAVACWAVANAYAAPTGALAAESVTRASNFDTFLRPSQNTQLRNGVDGAEALFARGALALVSGRMETWDELYETVTLTSERPLAVAASQALLFAPRQSATRVKLAEFLTRENVGRGANREPVIAAALMIVAMDGTDRGVDACRAFLRNPALEPRGKIDDDVRFRGAIGLLRALLAGRVAPEKRETAVNALLDAVTKALAAVPDTRPLDKRDAPLFRAVLREIARPLSEALQTNPDARPTQDQVKTLEDAFVDPDALTSRDPIDVVVYRLNHAFSEVYGLNNLPSKMIVQGGVRIPNKEKQELFLLKDWLDRYPYFTRIDLMHERGREPVSPAVPLRDDVEMDRR
jgi:hypothetical protein